MELKRALELRTEYAGTAGVIRVDGDDFICLNEMAAFFPSKDIKEWQKNKATQEWVDIVSAREIGGNPPIIAKRGKGGGTWAHHMVAFEFATWLSPEFKYTVYKAYIEGKQGKQNWNIKRIMAANNYKLMCKAIEGSHDPAKHYHYSNEARMLNNIVFGEHEGNPRDNASESQLDAISWLESRNGAYIEAGMEYQARKELLIKLYTTKYLPKNEVKALSE